MCFNAKLFHRTDIQYPKLFYFISKKRTIGNYRCKWNGYTNNWRTISPNMTMFSPLTRKIPLLISPYSFPTCILSIVSCKTRFAKKESGNLKNWRSMIKWKIIKTHLKFVHFQHFHISWNTRKRIQFYPHFLQQKEIHFYPSHMHTLKWKVFPKV